MLLSWDRTQVSIEPQEEVLSCPPSLPVVTSLQVSIPLDKVQVYPVSIPYPPLSWPRALFMSSSVENLDGLQRRISKAEIAPLGKYEFLLCY